MRVRCIESAYIIPIIFLSFYNYYTCDIVLSCFSLEVSIQFEHDTSKDTNTNTLCRCTIIHECVHISVWPELVHTCTRTTLHMSIYM